MESAVLDACVLYPATLRDFLLRLAEAGLYEPLWSETILDECFRSIQQDRPDVSVAQLQRTRNLMNEAFEMASVQGHEANLDQFVLPDPDDRHVLAAAVHQEARWIVTFNLRDFPASTLRMVKVEAIHPDAFVLDCPQRDAPAVVEALYQQQASLQRPRPSMDELLSRLRKQGLSQSMDTLLAMKLA